MIERVSGKLLLEASEIGSHVVMAGSWCRWIVLIFCLLAVNMKGTCCEKMYACFER